MTIQQRYPELNPHQFVMLKRELLELVPPAKNIDKFPEMISTEWIENNPHESTQLGHLNGYNLAIDQITAAIEGYFEGIK